ncbi:Protein kinase [Coemansia sp. RSA 2052]|nr:Protein kinase [Coemansia sp. RSA 2052]
MASTTTASGSSGSGSSKQTIGSYTVLQTLGVGSFGKVKLAVHSQTGHKVALKIIGRSKLAHSDMVGRVNREIQYLKMLRHPHIIKLYEVITTATDIIMVIEYAGGELFNYIVERGRMSEKDARRFFQQMVSAVEYCHRRNIVHRDLKPENVLLDPYDNVKVADFGLSNIMKDGEFLQTSCGSPNYAAPEVINGKLYAGPEVDAWSCGVILYVMLCGRLPFDDDHIPALFKKITSGVFTMPGYLSLGARAVLSGLLQVDPLKRMTLAQCRQHAWFTTDLPEYLRPLPESTDIEGLARLDESILGELERQLEMGRAALVGQLRQRGTNPAKVAYQLTLDNRHVLEQSRNSNKQGIRSFALASSPPAAFHVPEAAAAAVVETSSIAILCSSLPRSPGHTLESQMYKMRLRGPSGTVQPAGAITSLQTAAPRVSSPLAPATPQTITQQQVIAPPNYFRAALPPLAGTPTTSGPHSASSSVASLAKAPPPPPAATAANPYSHRTGGGGGADSGGAPSPLAQSVDAAEAASRKRAKATRTRWHFGIRSRSPPADVMAEVYRALQQLQMTWKHFGPFRLRAKTPGADPVKIDLQLYKLDTRDNYLVDFKAVIPQVRADQQADAAPPAYRAGENTLIAPPPPFIQAARRRLSAAATTQAGAFRAAQLADEGAEPRSLDDQFLDSSYPIQLPAELPAPAGMGGADRSDMLPEPDTLPARTPQRRIGAVSPLLGRGLAGGDSSESMAVDSPGLPGLPGGGASGARAMDIPRAKPALGGIGAGLSVGSNPSAVHFAGGTPRSQGRAPGSYMPGSVVGRVSLARADVSLTADGVGAGNGANRQPQERVVNIFPFFDVCCRLITELAVPSAQPAAVPAPS